MRKAVFIILCLLSSNLEAEDEVEVDPFTYHLEEPQDTPGIPPSLMGFIHTAD